ncbi:MAG TPA: putative sulfate exporter family transporter, partial [Oligoflexia bacterium]|nr:putative sulfate exporter family transporter [Oligoflexia bacterium]
NELDIIPLTTWMQVIIGVVVVFAVAIWLGRRLEIEPVTTLLVGVGTAICGAAAIALCAPLLKSKPKETSIALLTITCWSIAGIVLYPHLHAILAMTQENYALLCATTLHQTGAVTLAASSMGPSCAHTAMIIKGARTCIIIPVLCILACRNYLGEHKKPVSKLLIPWYVWAFLFAGAAFSFLPPLRPYVSCVMPATKLLWTMAMTALGLTVHLREITCDMRKPLLLGLVVWSAVIGNYFVGYYGMGY